MTLDLDYQRSGEYDFCNMLPQFLDHTASKKCAFTLSGQAQSHKQVRGYYLFLLLLISHSVSSLWLNLLFFSLSFLFRQSCLGHIGFPISNSYFIFNL